MADSERSTRPPVDSETPATDFLPDTAAPEGETIRPSNDELPPMVAPARGPLDQAMPDVATGSTPVTRKDD
jgi:hypothetical protein